MTLIFLTLKSIRKKGIAVSTTFEDLPLGLCKGHINSILFLNFPHCEGVAQNQGCPTHFSFEKKDLAFGLFCSHVDKFRKTNIVFIFEHFLRKSRLTNFDFEFQDFCSKLRSNSKQPSIIAGYFRLMDVLLSHVQSCSDRSQQALSSIYDWMKRYCEQCPSNTSVDVFKPAADLYFKMDLRTKKHTNLFKDLAFKIKAEIGILNDSTSQVNHLFFFIYFLFSNKR